MINQFKSTRDYRDICYLVDHVTNVKIRISLLKELGYSIGLAIPNNKSRVKDVVIGKQGELRMQVTSKYKGVNLAHCVIINSIENE